MNDNILFKIFSKNLHIIHAFSTRQLGNLKPSKEKNNFLTVLNSRHHEFFSNLNIPSKKTVFMEQVHGDKVASCDYDCRGHWIPGVDGLITKEKNLFLCVNTADCTPIFFFENRNKIIGLAHAGWQGTLGEIGKIMIHQIVEKHGGKVKNILVGIGPSICGKCYEVDKERYDLFENIRHCERNDKVKKNGAKRSNPLKSNDRKYFLDLKEINAKILFKAGIKPENIEISSYCTACRNNLFFSYRKNNLKDYGEMLGVIGMI